MKNMIIDLGSGQSCLAYNRGGQTQYRMGDSLVDEEETSTPELKKFIKEFVELEEKKSLKEAKRDLQKDKKDLNKDEDKEKPESEEGTDAGTQEEGADETEGEDDGTDEDIGDLE